MIGMGVAGEQILLVTSLVIAFALALLYFSWRGHGAVIRRLMVPMLGVVVLSVPDALVTLLGTWSTPLSEANPFISAFLRWSGHWGLCAAFPAWVLSWALIIDGLETVRVRLPRRLGGVTQSLQLYIVYALALGHLDGLTSWTRKPPAVLHASLAVVALLQRHGPQPLAAFPLGYVLYPSLTFGAFAALTHLALRAVTLRGVCILTGWQLARMAFSWLGLSADARRATGTILSAVAPRSVRSPSRTARLAEHLGPLGRPRPGANPKGRRPG